MPTLTIPASVAKRKQACRSCRQRKKKCDAGHPACALCRKWGTRCIYDSLVEHQRDEWVVSSNANKTLSEVQPAGHPAAFANQQHVDFQDNPQPRGPSLGMATPEALGSYPTPDSSIRLGEGANDQDLLADLQLPTHDLLLELVELFFTNFGHLFPCFHIQSFRNQLDEGVVQNACPMLLFAICSMACRFYPNQTVRARQQDWYDQAKLNYELTQRNPHSPLRTIQAVLVLVSYGYTTGDFSAGFLSLGKVWKQVVTIELNRLDASPDTFFDHSYHGGTTALEQEEHRRTMWMLFITDRNYSWPTGSPTAISELHFTIDLPIPDQSFQNIDLAAECGPVRNISFTRNLSRLTGSVISGGDTVNVFAYVCVAHVLLGRVADLVHSLHASPASDEYAEECNELDEHLVRFRLSLPRQATLVLEARPPDRGHVIWLQVILHASAMLLHYRCSTSVTNHNASPPFSLAVAAARNIAQIVKDASRISTDLLMSVHIAPALYFAASILVIEWRISGDQSYKADVDLLALVFDRMDEVFVFLGLKFKLALEHDLRRSKESIYELRERGLRGLLADCSKWTHIKEEVERRGIPINIT